MSQRIIAQAAIDVATDAVQPGAYGFNVAGLSIVVSGGAYELPLDDDALAIPAQRTVSAEWSAVSTTPRIVQAGPSALIPPPAGDDTVRVSLLDPLEGATQQASITKPTPDSVAGDTFGEVAAATVPGSGLELLSASFIPGAALVANDANFANLLVRGRDAAGGAATLLASQTTVTVGNGGSGDWTAFAPVPLNLIAPALTPFVGGALTFEITKDGTGVIVPPGQLVLTLRRTDPLAVLAAPDGVITLTVSTLGVR
jgi:hypothetical protein